LTFLKTPLLKDFLDICQRAIIEKCKFMLFVVFPRRFRGGGGRGRGMGRSRGRGRLMGRFRGRGGIADRLDNDNRRIPQDISVDSSSGKLHIVFTFIT
jgi:hypothetical protein